MIMEADYIELNSRVTNCDVRSSSVDAGSVNGSDIRAICSYVIDMSMLFLVVGLPNAFVVSNQF